MKRRFLTYLTLISLLGSLWTGVAPAQGQPAGEQTERPQYSIWAKYDDQTAKVTGDLSVKVPVTGEPMNRIFTSIPTLSPIGNGERNPSRSNRGI